MNRYAGDHKGPPNPSSSTLAPTDVDAYWATFAVALVPKLLSSSNAAIACFSKGVHAVGYQAKRHNTQQQRAKWQAQEFSERGIQSFCLLWIKLDGCHNQEEPDNGEDHAERAIAKPAEKDYKLSQLRTDTSEVEPTLELRSIGLCEQVEGYAKHHESHNDHNGNTGGGIKQTYCPVLGRGGC